MFQLAQAAGAASPQQSEGMPDAWLSRPTTLTLTQSGGSDYVFDLLYRPQGSAATLSIIGGGALFTPDVLGTYLLRGAVTVAGVRYTYRAVVRATRSSTGIVRRAGAAAPAEGELPDDANVDGSPTGLSDLWEGNVNMLGGVYDLPIKLTTDGSGTVAAGTCHMFFDSVSRTVRVKDDTQTVRTLEFAT